MSPPSPECPDCKVPMDSGFIVDFTYGTDASEQSSWVKGTAAADCDISLPDVRSAEIIRAGS